MLTTLLHLPHRAVASMLLGTALVLGACQSEPATTTTVAAGTEAATPVHAAAYICPMNCKGSESDKPGKCPVCEMDLVANSAAAPVGQ